MSSYTEAVALGDSLSQSGPVSKQLVPVVNALIAKAKEEKPDSVSLTALPMLEANSVGYADIDSASLKSLMAVVAAALYEGPAFA